MEAKLNILGVNSAECMTSACEVLVSWDNAIEWLTFNMLETFVI